MRLSQTLLIFIITIPMLFGNGPGEGFNPSGFTYAEILDQTSCQNVVTGGLVQGDELGCPNPTWDPSPITNVALPTGGTGDLQYLWIFTTGDPNTPLSQWTPIPNSNSANYDPGPISVTTYYRRCARRSGCTEYIGESNIVAKEALCCDNVTNGGQIGNDQAGCETPFNPAPLVNLAFPTGGSNNLVYQWITSSTGTPYFPGSADWAVVPNATQAGYDPGPVSQTTYFIRLSRRHGCSDFNGVSNMVTILVSAPISAGAFATHVTCLGGNDGSIDLTVAGGTAPYNYVWAPALGNVQNPQDVAAGNYSVTVTDANGCLGQTAVTVNDGIQLFPVVDWTDETCTGANNGTATVTSAGGGVPSYSYLWSHPGAGTVATATNLPSGNFTVTVTDANGCNGQTSFSINSGIQFSIGLDWADESCAGANDGTATVTGVTNGTPGFNYSWSFPPAGNTAAITDLPPDNYTVTVTDANGCSGETSFTIGQGTPLSLTLDWADESCSGAGNGTATVTGVANGTPSFTYAWSFAPAGNTAAITDLPPDNYTVTVTDANGCSGETSFSIGEGTPLSLTLDWADESCSGAGNGTATVTGVANGTPGFTYEWSFAPAGNTAAITDLPPDNYSVTVTDDQGCNGTGSLTIAAGPALQLSVSTSPALCPGGDEGAATVTSVTGGDGNYTYQWDDNAVQTTQTATGLVAGSYTVSVNDDQGCTGTANAVVADGNPVVLNTTSTNASCGSSQDGTATVAVAGGTSPYEYQWDDNGLQTTATAFLLAAGNYSVTVTDANGCTASATQTVASPIDAEIQVSATNASCFGGLNGSVAVTVLNNNPANYFYQWNDPANTISPQVTGLPANTYTVTVTDGNGCMTTGSATVLQPSELVLTLQANDATCANSSDGSAEVFASGGTPLPGTVYQYAWNAAGNPQTQVLVGVSPGVYTVTVTDANGCTATGSIAINAPAAMNTSLATSDVSCAGLGNGSASVNVTGGSQPYSYLWDNGPASTTSAISNLGPGFYGLTITDANGCSATVTAMIFEPPALALTVQKTDVACVNDTDGTATAVVSGGVSPYNIMWGGGETTAQITGLPAGAYSVTVTDQNGCTITGSTQIISTTTLGVTVSATPADCFDSNNGSAQADVTGGSAPFIFSWSNGGATSVNSNLAAGLYSVTVTDADGCSVTGSATVTAPPQLTCATQVVSPVTHHNGNNGSVSVAPVGGTGSLSVAWSNGSTEQTVSGLASGTYTVTVSDGNGCTCTSSVLLTNPSKVGDFVWNDLNGNGLQDSGEPGIAGVTVRLIGATAGGVQVNLLTTTDSSGNYHFDGLVMGTYQIKVEPPALHLFTLANIGNNDNIDSDINPADSLSALFALPQGTYDSRWDAGLMLLDEKINIGDFVWEDANHNGLQDLNEQGIAGVPVRLFQMPGTVLVASTTTDQAGKYLFTDVMPGNYFVEFSLSTLPNGYVFAPQNVGNNHHIDSDPNPANGRTAVFTVFPFTPDNLTIDAGILKECDNVTDGGLIGFDEALCGLGADPSEIVNISLPSGGFGTLEYLWLSSTVPIYNGPGDPNWTPIPNSNSPNYNPGPINQNTYFIRCSRRQGCDDYPGETNVVAKTVTLSPLTQIIQQPGVLCINEGGTFAAAIAGGGATYFWEFGPTAVPQNANTRVVNGVHWTTAGTYTVTLTVTRFGCSASVSTTVQVNNCGNPIMVVDDLIATLQGEEVELEWSVIGDASEIILYIQRSEDGVVFENLSAVAGVPGVENSTYRFMDPKPRLGENIYRIRFRKFGDVPVEGYSATATVFYQPEGMRVGVVYPNPTAARVTLELFEPNEFPVQVQLWNGQGRVLELLEMPPFSEKLEFDLSGFPQGIYWFSIRQKGFREQVLKVVKI